MPNSYKLIDKKVVTSSVATVELTGITAYTSANVNAYPYYVVYIHNMEAATNGAIPLMRVQEGGTTRTDAEFDRTAFELFSNTTFGEPTARNETQTNLVLQGMSNGAGKGLSAVIDIGNAGNSGNTTEFYIRTSAVRNTGEAYGFNGGAAWSRTAAIDGLEFRFHTGNINNGTFSLFGVVFE